MSKHLFVGLVMLDILSVTFGVQAGTIENRPGRWRVPKEVKRSGVHALIRNPSAVTPLVSTAVLRQAAKNARHHFKGSEDVLKNVQQSVVQISRPKHSSVLGTGFILKNHEQLWVAMPYHLAGEAGQIRTVRVLTKDGRILEKDIAIALNGTAGWHSPDISLAVLPREWTEEVKPFTVAPADVTQEVYSVGYIAGDLHMQDIMPVTSQFFYVDPENMLRRFHVPGSTLQHPISGNGYCGSPLLQKIDGEWKVVGMHNGHSMDLTKPDVSVGSSVNLYVVVPQLIDNYFHSMLGTRGLTWRGWEMDRLGPMERVDSIEVIPAGKAQQSEVLYLRNFTGVYSDTRVEEALGGLNLQKGDRLIFNIVGHTAKHRRVNRQVTFTIP